MVPVVEKLLSQIEDRRDDCNTDRRARRDGVPVSVAMGMAKQGGCHLSLGWGRRRRSGARRHAGLVAELGQFSVLFCILSWHRLSSYYMADAEIFRSLIRDFARQSTPKKHFNPSNTFILIFNFFPQAFG